MIPSLTKQDFMKPMGIDANAKKTSKDHRFTAPKLKISNLCPALTCIVPGCSRNFAI